MARVSTRRQGDALVARVLSRKFSPVRACARSRTGLSSKQRPGSVVCVVVSGGPEPARRPVRHHGSTSWSRRMARLSKAPGSGPCLEHAFDFHGEREDDMIDLTPVLQGPRSIRRRMIPKKRASSPRAQSHQPTMPYRRMGHGQVTKKSIGTPEVTRRSKGSRRVPQACVHVGCKPAPRYPSQVNKSAPNCSAFKPVS